VAACFFLAWPLAGKAATKQAADLRGEGEVLPSPRHTPPPPPRGLTGGGPLCRLDGCWGLGCSETQ
jgi:hypothetical protein